MSYFLLFYLLILNLGAFLLCGYDKRLAKKRKFRISEKKLFLVSALGGAFGFFTGMQVFRHKTKHLSFQIGIPFLCILWLAALGFLIFHVYFL